MQFFGLLTIWTYLSFEIDDCSFYKKYEDVIHHQQNNLHAIFSALLIEHVASYFIELFRRYDIKYNGRLDINGVPRAKSESFLATLQYFYICFLIGYILKEVIEIDRDLMPYQVNMCLQWLIVEGILMLSTRIYVNLVLWLRITGEITKNIFTLQFIQQQEKKEE